jgi:hypothetical protein
MVAALPEAHQAGKMECLYRSVKSASTENMHLPTLFQLFGKHLHEQILLRPQGHALGASSDHWLLE